MSHFRRATDETVGLILAVIVLIAQLNSWQGVATIFSILLVIFFLFRLAWGKEHVHQPHNRRRRR